MGPQGIGGLYVREDIDLIPLKHSGTGSASSKEVQSDQLPDKYESGTSNTPGLAGLYAATDFLTAVTVKKKWAQICQIGEKFIENLRSVDEIAFYGPRTMEQKVGIFSFTVKNRDIAEVAGELERHNGIMMRVGLHCAPSAHKVIGTFPQGTIRASIGYYSAKEEAKYLVSSLKEKCAAPD